MRKTNLFYTEGEDSKFLTFSNYTESLTGNFLSTDTKLFPSMFLCLYIDKLNKVNNEIKEVINPIEKRNFINSYLISYYENKLAVLRDNCIKNNENYENYVTPLAYLLKCIYMYNNSVNINYVGDITEQDYNGTYTDTICIVDFNKYYYCDSIDKNINGGEVKRVDFDKTLYGWNERQLNTWFNGSVPAAIGEGGIGSTHKYYDYMEKDFSKLNIKQNTSNSIKFNVIIPLYDVTNINYHTNETAINNITSIDLSDATTSNIPLGIWFSDKTIELSKDSKTGYSETWSLVISSQFKPFPYGKLQVDSSNLNTNSNAFPTFAMVLAKQNEVIDKFTKLEAMILAQNEKINTLQSNINNTATLSNIDKIKTEMIKDIHDVTNKFNEFKQDINDVINNLRWKGAV